MISGALDVQADNIKMAINNITILFMFSIMCVILSEAEGSRWLMVVLDSSASFGMTFCLRFYFEMLFNVFFQSVKFVGAIDKNIGNYQNEDADNQAQHKSGPNNQNRQKQKDNSSWEQRPNKMVNFLVDFFKKLNHKSLRNYKFIQIYKLQISEIFILQLI